MTFVSSTNLFHSLGKSLAEAKALDSKYSIKRLATIGDKGKPMATPLLFSKNSPSKLKKSGSETDLNQTGCIRVRESVNNLHSLLYRNTSVKGDHIESYKNVPRVKLNTLKLFNKGRRVFNERLCKANQGFKLKGQVFSKKVGRTSDSIDDGPKGSPLLVNLWKPIDPRSDGATLNVFMAQGTHRAMDLIARATSLEIFLRGFLGSFL